MARLFIPGPTDLHPDVQAAQNQPMIGHRGPEFEALFARIQSKLRPVFRTEGRVFVSTSSGTGLQEAAIRNCVEEKVLCCVNGAFSARWFEVAVANGKTAERLDAGWGRAVRPEMIGPRLDKGGISAVTLVHNETSTGVASPLQEVAALVRQRYPEVLLLVDAVSSLGGDRLEFDAWGIDVLLTSSQKCLAAPPGLSLAAVSDRAMERTRSVSSRGLYFDFLDLEKYLIKNQTPATPAISLLWALDRALDRTLTEGLESRWDRHAQLAARTQAWAQARLALYSESGYHSRTVTCLAHDGRIDVARLNLFLNARGMQVADGYGPLRSRTFRIAHMGETRLNDLDELLSAVDDYLEPRLGN